MVAQKADDASGTSQGPSPGKELPPGGTAIEDLLLQKGTITMDEWIQIRAEQEYRAADQARRIDAIEEWKYKTEVLPMLRDKVNFGLNALQFLYGHLRRPCSGGTEPGQFFNQTFGAPLLGQDQRLHSTVACAVRVSKHQLNE